MRFLGCSPRPQRLSLSVPSGTSFCRTTSCWPFPKDRRSSFLHLFPEKIVTLYPLRSTFYFRIGPVCPCGAARSRPFQVLFISEIFTARACQLFVTFGPLPSPFDRSFLYARAIYLSLARLISLIFPPMIRLWFHKSGGFWRVNFPLSRPQESSPFVRTKP